MYFSAWLDRRERLDWPDLTHLVITPKCIRYSEYDPSPPASASAFSGYEHVRR